MRPATRVCGRPRDTDMQGAPRAKFGDEGGEKRAKKRSMELKKIAGPDILRVGPEEGCPRPTMRRRVRLPHGVLDRLLRDLDIQLQQLALDALDAPQAVGDCQCLDQGNRRFWDPWCACLRLPFQNGRKP